MNILNRKERKTAKLRAFIIYGVSIILIFFGFYFYGAVGSSDYNMLREGSSNQQVLLDKMRDIGNNIGAIENFDSELQNAKQQNQIAAIGRIRLSIDSSMTYIDEIITTIGDDNQDELSKEIYENYRTYQANREIISFLNNQLENQGGSGSMDPEVRIILDDVRNLINQADEAVNGAGKRAGKNELNEVKRLVTQMKAKISML